MALQATYGNSSAFNVKIYDLAGGGYYAAICDSATQLYQRRGNAQDTKLYVGGSSQFYTDRFTAYSYNSGTSTVTLTGAIDTYLGATFTRIETYRFVSDYVIEDNWSVVVNQTGCGVEETNWNYYGTINSIWDINNTNFTNGSSFLQLGIGVQLTSNGPVYGTISDSEYGCMKNNEKRYGSGQGAIASNWVKPGNGEFNLTINQTLNIKQWFFKSTNTLYDFMLQATLAVSAGNVYTGSTWNKICQATAYLNTGLMSDFTNVKLNPSSNYANGTWMRDSFWVSFLISNAFEQNTITMFENNQNGSGQIPTTLFSANSTVFYHDESTLLYIIRAYYDKTIRGLTVNNTVLANALTFITNQVVGDQYQNAPATFQTWMDQYTFAGGKYCGYNQGIYCVALKCAQLLGLSVTNTQITNAITQYQALYDSVNKYIKFTNDTTILAPDVLTGEALNLFLFGQPLLTDIQVINHITTIRAKASTAAGVKCIVNLDGGAVTFGGFSSGDFQAGGSWFLYEYLMYYAGFYHNCFDAGAFLNSRIAIEIAKDPVSHEYIQTITTLPYFGSEDPARHVYSWNSASTTIKTSPRQPII